MPEEKPDLPPDPTPAETLSAPDQPAEGGRPRESRATSAGDAGLPFGRYRLLLELGRGGMGVVWKAWDTALRRVVALKQILSAGPVGQERVERFLREARAAARLRHPNIVSVLDAGDVGGERYFTTEYIEGRSLDLYGKRPMPARMAAGVVRTVARALACAHEQGIVHRDVKPSNVLVDAAGVAHVTDFGLAKDLATGSATELTRTGALMGTPAYMSPEQAGAPGGGVGPASDQFSLGAVLYELVTGRHPFEAPTVEARLVAIRVRSPLPPRRHNPRLSRDIETISLRALEKDPAHRYPSMGDLADDLERFLSGEAIQARPIPAPARLWRKIVRHRKVVLPVAAGAALAVSIGGWWGFRTASEQQRLEEALDEAAKRESAREDALRLLESGRPALDGAQGYLYNPGADYEELRRQVEIARGWIDRAVQRDPDLAQGHYLLGLAWEIEGWEDRAEACWRRAIDLDPDFAPPRLRLGRLLLVRAFLAGLYLGMDIDETGDRRSQAFAAEATNEIERALASPSAPGEEIERDIAAGMLAWARREHDKVLSIAMSGIERLGDRRGAEEYHWLAGLVAPDAHLKFSAYDNAISIRPKFATGLFCRAVAREQLGDRDGARADYDDALRIRPRFVLAYNNRGVLRSQTGDLPGALEDYDRALSIDSRFAPAYVNRGAARENAGDPPGAVEDHTRAIDIAPGMALAWAARAHARLAAGDRDLAESDAQEALRLDPAIGAALDVRAFVRWRKGDDDGALADCDEAVRLGAESFRVREVRADIRRRRGDLAGALEDYDEYLRQRPAEGSIHYCRALARTQAGDEEGALADAEEALRLGYGTADVHVVLAVLREAKGDLDGALAAYDEAVRLDPGRAQALDPKRAEAHRSRGRIRLAREDLAGALKDFDVLLALLPGDTKALAARAETRRQSGDLAGAVADCEEILRLEPENADAHGIRGLARLAGGDPQGALADFDRSLELRPGYPSAHAGRADARLAQGDVLGAIADYEKALEFAPPRWPQRPMVERKLQAARNKKERGG